MAAEGGDGRGGAGGSGGGAGDYRSISMLRSTDSVSDPDVPFLHEIWTWEGDETILPRKWSRVVQAAFGDFAKDRTPEWFKATFECAAQFDKQGTFFITKRSDVVGTAMAWCDADEAELEACTLGRLHWLGVVPKHRGKGVAKALIRLALRHHASRGRKFCWLNTEDFREDAIRLYEKEGFRVVARRPLPTDDEATLARLLTDAEAAYAARGPRDAGRGGEGGGDVDK